MHEPRPEGLIFRPCLTHVSVRVRPVARGRRGRRRPLGLSLRLCSQGLWVKSQPPFSGFVTLSTFLALSATWLPPRCLGASETILMAPPRVVIQVNEQAPSATSCLVTSSCYHHDRSFPCQNRTLAHGPISGCTLKQQL